MIVLGSVSIHLGCLVPVLAAYLGIGFLLNLLLMHISEAEYWEMVRFVARKQSISLRRAVVFSTLGSVFFWPDMIKATLS